MNGALWNDFARGEGGNVWQLALLMKHGDRREAMKSLCNAAGVAFIEGGTHEKRLTDLERAISALAKVQSVFAIGENTPQEVKDYLSSRMVAEDSLRFFAYTHPLSSRPRRHKSIMRIAEVLLIMGLSSTCCVRFANLPR